MTLYWSPRRPPGAGSCWSCVSYRPEGCVIGRPGWPDIGRLCEPSKDGLPGYEYEPGSDEAEIGL